MLVRFIDYAPSCGSGCSLTPAIVLGSPLGAETQTDDAAVPCARPAPGSSEPLQITQPGRPPPALPHYVSAMRRMLTVSQITSRFVRTLQRHHHAKLDHKTHLSSQSARANKHVLQSRALTTSGMKTLHPNATTGAKKTKTIRTAAQERAPAEGCRSRLPRWLRTSRGRRDRLG
ncbi:hypothetical protein BJX66DRAFT_318321 [Aspergillus keveii]|uniref:Uncharacterized protein n=1 Tax=Aspergillus keveii TaxID=714993 RepID=A0ABR4FJY1_9EURO